MKLKQDDADLKVPKNQLDEPGRFNRMQLKTLEKQLSRPAYKLYPVILIVIIILVHLLDTYATDVCTKVQSLYIKEFFVLDRGLSFESGLQQATIISTIGYIFVVIGPFYKALMDKVGRKPIFVINTAGMALGMLVCFVSPNFYVFAVGQIMITFFTMHDMQMMYVYEVAPAKWRSTLYFTCKFIGIFGTLAIPLLRDKYVQANGSGWRYVFVVPALIGLVIFVMSAFLMRESDIFAKNRLEYLHTPPEQRKADKKAKKDKKSGIVPGLKYIFKHYQLRWLAITLAITCTSLYAITMYYESYLSTAISTEKVTKVLYYQPFAMSVMYLLSGFLSDLIGRKKTICIFSATTICGFLAFIISTKKGLSPAAIGIFLGLYLGSFWNVTDLNGLMFAESAPTELRGSIMGCQTLILGLGTAASLLICTILLSFAKLGTIMFVVGVPGLAIGAILTVLKIRETKGTNLEDIKYTE